MEKDRLIERLRFVMGKKDVLALAQIFTEIDDGIAILFDLCKSDNEKISFHAAWVLENTLTSNREIFCICLVKIVETIPAIENPSTKRHFCKLLNLAFENCRNNIFPKDSCQLLNQMEMEPVIESCFEWLMDPMVKPAVKVHCMDILVHLSNRYQWIRDDLPYVINLQLIDGTPGLINKGNKIIKSLGGKIH